MSNLSEEEIKAIDRLKYALIYDRESISSLMGFNDIKIVLQLVNKQQKEIERLNRELICCDNMYKKMKKDMKKEIEELKAIINKEHELNLDKCYVKLNFISKDKIRELLEKYDKSIAWANADDHYYFVKYIKELLEE